MPYVLPILLLLVGIALGGGAVWVLLRAKIAQAYERGKNESGATLAAQAERLDGRENAIEELRNRLQESAVTVEQRQRQVTELNGKVAQLETSLAEQRKQTEEKLALLEDAKAKLSDAFKALAADALQSSNTSFLQLAKAQLEKFQEMAKGDLSKRQTAIDELVRPVRESLGKVDAKLQEIEKSRIEAYTALREQVKSLTQTEEELRSQTSNLVKALRRPQVRGRWGEIQLRRVVEMAGMINHCDFFEQLSTETEDGQLRPDLIVQLPGNKSVVVDAKTPLSAYLEAIEAPDEATRSEKLKSHARQVRDHISKLSRKSYFEQFDQAPEFVVLFLPGEVFFSAALEQDPALIEIGVEHNVIIATPTTLIALLRAVAYGWRQEQLAENAQAISQLGRELHKRLSDVAGHIAKLGKALGAATGAYNRAIGSLESRVLVSARKFEELGAAGVGTEIEQLPPIETTSRMLQAPELDAPASGDQADGSQ